MGDEGEKQIEIWKVKRVSAPCLILLAWDWARSICALPDVSVCYAAHQSFRSGKRKWDIHDQSYYASKGSGVGCDCYGVSDSSVPQWTRNAYIYILHVHGIPPLKAPYAAGVPGPENAG